MGVRVFGHNGGLFRADGGILNGQNAAAVAGQMDAIAPAGQQAAVAQGDGAFALHTHHHNGETVDVNARVVNVDGRGTDAEDSIAVAAGAGQGQPAVFDEHFCIVGAVYGQYAPAVGGQLTVGVMDLRVVGQLAQTVAAPHADAPAPAPQFRGGRAVGQTAVSDCDYALAAGVDGAAGDAGKVNVAVVDGHAAVAQSGYARAHTDEVVEPHTVEFHTGMGDSVVAVAVDNDAGEVVPVGGQVKVFCRPAGELAAVNSGGDALVRLQSPVYDAHGRFQIDGCAAVDGGIGRLGVVLGHGKGDVALIFARGHRQGAGADGQNKIGAFRGAKLRVGGDNQPFAGKRAGDQMQARRENTFNHEYAAPFLGE